MRRTTCGFVFALCGAFMGCGDGGGEDGGTDPGLIGPEGGVVMTGDGALALHIPPNALSEPTDIVILPIDVSEADASLQEFEPVVAYRLMPDGLTFAEPVTVVARVSVTQVDPDNPDGSHAVFGLLSYSASVGVEVVGAGAERMSGPNVEYLGSLTHFSDLVLGKAFSTRLELECETDCLVGTDGMLPGELIVRSSLPWAPEPMANALFPRVGSRGVTGSGAVQVGPFSHSFAPTLSGDDKIWSFAYECTSAGTGTIDAHFLFHAGEYIDSEFGPVWMGERPGAWLRRTVTCVDELPPRPLAVVTVDPVACPGDTINVLAEGFAQPEDREVAEVRFLSMESTPRELTADVLAIELVASTTEGIRARYDVRVPRGVQRGMVDWNVVVEVPMGMPRRSTGQLFQARLEDCSMAATDFIGTWRTIGDTAPGDGDCTGVNVGPRWRFWSDGTWSPSSPGVTDLMSGGSVHFHDGTWTGSWDGGLNAYTFTATGCMNFNGNRNEATGVYYPRTGILEVAYTGSRPPSAPVMNNHCATLLGHSSVVQGCHSGLCDFDREPFGTGTCLHSMSGDCYDETGRTCYDASGSSVP